MKAERPRPPIRLTCVIHLVPWAFLPRMDLLMGLEKFGRINLMCDFLGPTGATDVHFLCLGFRLDLKEMSACGE
jgi:hypothetical protein